MLIEKLEDKSARLGVMGLGYVGLPLAYEFAKAGFQVTGFDLLNDVVEGVNQGRSHVQDVPSDRLRKVVESGNLRASTDFSEITKLSAIARLVSPRAISDSTSLWRGVSEPSGPSESGEGCLDLPTSNVRS